MKKMIKVFLCFNLCLLPLLLIAQPPGYLGKRAILSIGASGSMAIVGPTINNKGSDDFQNEGGGFGINYEFEGNFSYVISRKRTIGLTVSQYNTGANVYTNTIAFGNNGFDYHNLFYKVNVKSVSLVLTRFKSLKGALAPNGNHFLFGLKRYWISGSIKDQRTDFYDPTIGATLGSRPIELDTKSRVMGLLFGWYKNRIFYDKIVFKSGMRFVIPIHGRWNFDDDDFSDDTENDFTNVAHERVGFHELFRVDLSIGYLLF